MLHRSFLLLATVLVCILPSTTVAHGAADGAVGIHDDKHCPICNMFVKDENLTWFTELKNGQRIYTCGMTNGTQFARGKNSFSHPSLVGATLDSLIVRDGTGCNNTCPECDDSALPVLDPITGTKITSAKFTYACLKKGQKIYFESETSKATFLDGASSKAYFGVAAMTCNSASCPDSFQEVPVISVTTPTTTSLRTNDADSRADGGVSEPFCSGASAMFSGFQSTVHGTCVKLLFQPWVLNSKLKYAIGIVGVFLLPLLNEGLVHAREHLRHIFRNRAKASTTTIATKRLHKLTLTALYMAQMTLAYFAMLVVMTYDSGLFVSLIVGFGVGYASFKHGKHSANVLPIDDNVSASSSTNEDAAMDGPAAPWRFQRMDDLVVLHVPGMKCAANCGSTIHRALDGLGIVDLVHVDMVDKCVYVAPSSSSQCNAAELVKIIDMAGFAATVLRAPKGMAI